MLQLLISTIEYSSQYVVVGDKIFIKRSKLLQFILLSYGTITLQWKTLILYSWFLHRIAANLGDIDACRN